MQTNARLGASLGQLLSGAFDPTARQRGELDGMRSRELQSQIDLQDAKADGVRQQTEFGTDESLAKSLAIAGGFNSQKGMADFNASTRGEYRAPAGPPTQEQFDGGMNAVPIPEYVSKFPELQANFAELKQMLALGDKNIEHLTESNQGDQRNANTARMKT